MKKNVEIRSAWLRTNEDDYFIGVIVFSSGWVNNLVRENLNFAKIILQCLKFFEQSQDTTVLVARWGVLLKKKPKNI